MYFKSRIKGKQGLPWFDARTKREKSSNGYFEKLDDLAQQLDDLDGDLALDTSLSPDDFDSGYEYVYGRIKELKNYIAQNELQDESNTARYDLAEDSLREIYEKLLDLYDSALLYDDYTGDDPEDHETDDDDLDSEDGDDDDWDDDWDDDDDRDDDEDKDNWK